MFHIYRINKLDIHKNEVQILLANSVGLDYTY
jgi:hypothetical protein